VYRIVAFSLGVVLATRSCPGDEHLAEAATVRRIGEVRERVAEYTTTHAHPPGYLAEICSPTADDCATLDPANRFPDGWGVPLEYRVEGGAFTLRSAGRDRRFGTADDIVHTAEGERQRVMRTAGCYELQNPRREPVYVLLDTVSVRPGWYGLRTSVNAVVGEWSAAADPVYLRFVAAPHVTFAVLWERGDTLAGYGVLSRGSEPVLGIRVQCGTTGVAVN
jgi:hypothetical protein